MRETRSVVDTTILAGAAQARADAAARRAHTAAQEGRRVPILESSAAYRTQFRLQQQAMPADLGPARVTTFGSVMERSGTITLNGKQLEHVSGYATVFDVDYPMWDEYGPYNEYVGGGAADRTLAADPDVMFLMNHRGAIMARTKPGAGMRPTLILAADKTGMHDDVYLNPKRSDVEILLSAVEDGLMTEQSFAFMVVTGLWSEDFTSFGILDFEIDRGDVSGVNFGANPYTSIGARSQELLPLLDRMPAGMARAAISRLSERSDLSAGTRVQVTADPEAVQATRGEGESIHTYRLAARIARTSARAAALAAAGDGTIDLTSIRMPWYEIRNDAGDQADEDGPTIAEVLIFDEIGGSFGVNAKDFAAEIAALEVDQLNVRINSPGGSLFDGLAIFNALNHHPANVTVYVDAIAASAASVIAMAGNEVVMMPGSQLMIHDAAMVQDGNAADMAMASTFLDRQSANVAGIYQGRAGGEAQAWRDLMLAETWMFADEAVSFGLADRVEPQTAAADREPVEQLQRSFDLSHFRYAGRRNAPAPGAGAMVTRTIAGGARREAVGGRVAALQMALDELDELDELD